MSDPLIHECNNFVVLEPGQPEKLLNADETILWLESWLSRLEKLPQDLEGHASLISAARRLLDTACALEVEPGFTLQWFAVRLDPPGS